MRTLRALLLNGLILLVALIATLFVAEGGLRLAAPQPTGMSHQDRYGLAMHWPGIRRYLPQYGTTVSFNSVGMRDREHAVAKPAGVYRILVLGDSFMEALQVEFEASLPSLLEHDLTAKTGKQIEVVNAGVSGWGTDDELRYLTEYGFQWEPDLVLVAMTLHNDVSDNLREDWHALHGDTLVEVQHIPASPFRYKVVELKGFLASHFQLYQLWRKVRFRGLMRSVGAQLDAHIVRLFRQPTPVEILHGFKLTDLLLARMDSLTRAHGARMALMLLPLRVQLTDQSFAAFVRAAGATAQEMPIAIPQDHMTATSKRLAIPLIDLLPPFRSWTAAGGAALYLENDGHWNHAGHKLAAEVATDALVQAGVVP